MGNRLMFFFPWMPFFAPRIRFPGGGDLTFPYSPYTKWEAPSFYRGDERVEHAVYTGVASPGSQLGNIIDLLDQLAKEQKLETPERKKIRDLKKQVDKIKDTIADNDETAARGLLDRLKSKDPKMLERIIRDYSDDSAST